MTQEIDGSPSSVYGMLTSIFPETRVRCLNQVHSQVIVRAEQCAEGEIPKADGILSLDPDIILCVRTADCIPILLWSDDVPCIGALHAGWRGLAKGIVKKAVHMMNSLGANEIHIRLGPSIGPCCYEVGPDVMRALGVQGFPSPAGTHRVDLGDVAKKQAMEAGVPEPMIRTVERCTSCNPLEYFSYRRDGALTGRNISLIGGKSCLLQGLQGE
ncbi:MAG: peptidoglycan editing factor PgeF [Desulfomonilia bacterium]